MTTAAADCIAPIFVPAHRPDRFAKAAASGADAIILDLEDGVPEDAKSAARDALRTDFTGIPVFIRINGCGTRWHAADIQAVEAHRPAAVMLPKAESANDATQIARRCRAPIVALIETAQGVANARAIASCCSTARLAFGSIDLAADLGCAPVRDALALARGEIVLASRLARLPPPLDGVTTRLRDTDLVADDARYAQMLGFGGKLVIHPAQVNAVLTAFRPGNVEIDWACQVLSGPDGAVSIDGAMIDDPVRKRARSILQRAAAGQSGTATKVKETAR